MTRQVRDNLNRLEHMRKAAVENSEGGYNALELNSFIYDEEEKAILDNQTEFA